MLAEDKRLSVRSHQDSRIDNASLPIGKARFDRPYQRTFDFPGDYINAAHHRFATCQQDGGLIDVGIEGWLLPDDALKLYEMVYFADGDILELGTYKGLSTSIMA